MSTQTNLNVETPEDHAILMGEALERLQKNPDFKRVIREGYLEAKVLASVSLLAVPQIKDNGKRPAVVEDLIAASNLQYFFMQVEGAYQGAKDPVLSDDEQAEFEQAQEDARMGLVS